MSQVHNSIDGRPLDSLQAWIQAARGVSEELLSGTDPAGVFRLLAAETLRLTDADVSLVAVPSSGYEPDAEFTEVLIAEAVGAVNHELAKAVSIPVERTVMGQVFKFGQPLRSDSLDLPTEIFGDGGPALTVPLVIDDTVACVIITLRHSASQRFTEEQLVLMTAFVDRAAMAWQLATAQNRMGELDVLADRDRIARNLHDHVIQRLFAIGLALQGTITRASSVETRRRLTECVDDLQNVIQEIRGAIFELHQGPAEGTRLRRRIDQAIAQFVSAEVHTNVRYDGPLSMINHQLADHAEAVVREAVSNAVRHGSASEVNVRVSVDDNLRIEVADDGSGMRGMVVESGLANLRHRAQASSGAFAILAADGGGTVLRWSAPIR